MGARSPSSPRRFSSATSSCCSASTCPVGGGGSFAQTSTATAGLLLAGEFIGFIVVAVFGSALGLAWLVAGRRPGFARVGLVFAYLYGGAWIGFCVGGAVLGAGVELVDPGFVARAIEALQGLRVVERIGGDAAGGKDATAADARPGSAPDPARLRALDRDARLVRRRVGRVSAIVRSDARAGVAGDVALACAARRRRLARPALRLAARADATRQRSMRAIALCAWIDSKFSTSTV